MRSQSSQPHSRLPAYLHVAQLLRQRILGGLYQAHEFLPPERDLAAELGVSRQTVRLAIDRLRQEGSVVPEQGRGTRIVAAAALSQTAPLPNGFQLAALIIYGLSRESSAAICQGCASVMRQADYHLIVAETMIDQRQRAHDEAKHLRDLLDKGIGGLIIYAEPTAQNRALLEEALGRGVHVVQIDRCLPDLPCDYVGVDNVGAAREIVTHLIGRGHRRIAMLSHSLEPSTCYERRQGYRAALRTAGLSDETALVGYIDILKENDLEIERQVQYWLSLPQPPTAIFAINDDLALLVIQVLRRRGLRVPADMAVVGFDNHRVAAFVSPPLTTVRQPFGDMGATAAQLLLTRMTGHYGGGPRRVLLPTHLVVRQSCGTEPAPASLPSALLR